MEGCGRKTVKGYVEIKASCVSNAKNIIENLCAQAAAPNRTIMNVTTSTADAGKDDVQNADHFQHGFALWCHKIVLLTM